MPLNIILRFAEVKPSMPFLKYFLSSILWFRFRCGKYGVSGSSISAGEVALLSAVVTISGGMSVKFGFDFSDINLEFWSQENYMTVLPAAVCASKSSVLFSFLNMLCC